MAACITDVRKLSPGDRDGGFCLRAELQTRFLRPVACALVRRAPRLTRPVCFCFPVARDIQQETFRASHAHWRGFSFVYNHYLFSGCFLVVLLSILLYLLRLRRIHRRTPRGAATATLWLEEGLPSQMAA